MTARGGLITFTGIGAIGQYETSYPKPVAPFPHVSVACERRLRPRWRRHRCGFALQGHSPRRLGRPTPSEARALDLLGSVTQLGSPRGRGVLSSNLDLDVAINNRASKAVRARALVDAQITASNANTLADGLGATMADIYRRKAWFRSDDDGRHSRSGAISPAISAVIARANGQSAGDSNAGKFGFADGLDGTYAPPAGGIFDVLGRAYGRLAGTPGADRYGNSRPFQTAPLEATSGPRIETFDGLDSSAST